MSRHGLSLKHVVNIARESHLPIQDVGVADCLWKILRHTQAYDWAMCRMRTVFLCIRGHAASPGAQSQLQVISAPWKFNTCRFAIGRHRTWGFLPNCERISWKRTHQQKWADSAQTWGISHGSNYRGWHMLHHVALAQKNWLLPTINQRWARPLRK